jgi:cytochrome c oxidase subunit 1
MNMLATLGAVVLALGILAFMVNVLWSRRFGRVPGDNPWGAGTLEWATSSPPPHCNFIYPPTVAGAEPIWDNAPDQPVVAGLRDDLRDVLITHVLDATPDHRLVFPEPSIWPLISALVTTALFIGSIFTPWAVVAGAVPLLMAFTGWFWPRSATEGGTAPWPIAHRTLPKPHEAPGEAA